MVLPLNCHADRRLAVAPATAAVYEPERGGNYRRAERYDPPPRRRLYSRLQIKASDDGFSDYYSKPDHADDRPAFGVHDLQSASRPGREHDGQCREQKGEEQAGHLPGDPSDVPYVLGT